MKSPRKCNWCNDLLDDQSARYCSDCELACKKECVNCHRPFPNEEHFNLHPDRCDACTKKIQKQNKKRCVKKSATTVVECENCSNPVHIKDDCNFYANGCVCQACVATCSRQEHAQLNNRRKKRTCDPSPPDDFIKKKKMADKREREEALYNDRDDSSSGEEENVVVNKSSVADDESDESCTDDVPPLSLLTSIKESTVKAVRQPRKRKDPIKILKAATVSDQIASPPPGKVSKTNVKLTAQAKRSIQTNFVQSLIEFSDAYPKKVTINVNL